MAKVYVFFANGFEDIEALAPVDILRRGGVEVVTVSINDTNKVESAHGVTILTDVTFEEIGSFADADLLVLPGGMPGAKNLNEHEGVRDALQKQYDGGKRIAAICAAPLVFGGMGLLKGKKATCYPGFESTLIGAEYTAEPVTVDGNITTGKGPGAAMAFGYQLLSYFTDMQTVESLKQGMMYA